LLLSHDLYNIARGWQGQATDRDRVRASPTLVTQSYRQYRLLHSRSERMFEDTASLGRYNYMTMSVIM
jgi:hypothetical protein